MAIDVATARYEDCVAAARAAEEARRFDAALVAWQRVRDRFPTAPAGYAGMGSSLRELGRLDEADAILEEGLEKAPGDECTAAAHAWVAHVRGDLPEAERRWHAVREAYPHCFDGYFGGAAVLRSLGSYDAADAVYRIAFARFPMAPQLLGDFAAVAQSRGDVEEAARRWTTLHTLFPDDLGGYLRRARAYRECGLTLEAETVLDDLQRRFPGEAVPLIEYARLAQDCSAWSEALRRWEAVVRAFHGRIEGYLGAVQALNELGRFADAETVLSPAVRLFPDSAAVVVANAWCAHYRRDYASAILRWEEVRRRFPREPQGHIGASDSLMAAGKTAAAAALIAAAQAAFPDEVEIWAAHARQSEILSDWDEAERRWAAVRERFPGVIVGIVGHVQSCLRAGKLDAAERLLADALPAAPHERELNRLQAECAVARRDWPAAEARWRTMTERFPGRPLSWAGLGDALRGAGRLADSEAVLGAALERFPGHRELELELAQTATARREWPQALGRWEALKARYPEDPWVQRGISEALWHARQDLAVLQSDPDAGMAPFVIPQSLLDGTDAPDGGHALRELFTQFESLGDTCEFGMVQRRFGAEPISLLRWTSTPVQQLVTALDRHLEGVGDAEHTVISVSELGEYTTADRRYSMFAHTFTLETAEPRERFTAQTLKRMKYLRRQLLFDLASGYKVFVYKSEEGLSDADARLLHTAIRRHGGDAPLLCVRLETPRAPCGTVVRLEEGLFMGHIDRFSTVDIHVDAWVEICRQVRTGSRNAAAGDSRPPIGSRHSS